MLACARLGAVHSVVFGGFAPHELASASTTRARRSSSSASCGIEVDRVIEYKPLLDRALELAEHKPEHCVILQRQQAEARSCRAATSTGARPSRSAAGRLRAGRGHRPALRPLHVGHDGMPKGVVRDNGGHAVALRWRMQHIYDTGPGEVYWAASDVGWVVGHSYIVYAPLLTGCTTVLYEGKPVGTPDPGAFWRVIAEHRVKTLFTAPTAFRAIKKEDPDGGTSPSTTSPRFEQLFLAGERLDPDTYHWAPTCSACRWSTTGGRPRPAGRSRRTAGPGAAAGQARARRPAGARLRRPDPRPDGAEVPRRSRRAIAIRLPLPPGTLPTLWGRRRALRDSYLARFPATTRPATAGSVRRRRLPVRDGPHRRRDQRRRPPAVDRSHGGGRWPAIPTSPSAP